MREEENPMSRVFKLFTIFFYLAIAVAVLLIALGFEEKLFSSQEVIETFEAGPIKSKKKVSGVKTNFTWTKKGGCKCEEDKAPCIQSFLDKNVSQPAPRYPRMIEDYYIQNKMGSEYQGAGQVPWGLDYASVRIINIPFCGQVRRGAKESTK